MTDPNDDEHASPRPHPLRVVVERTGGFAGLVRRWSVTPADDDAARWRALVDACPWDRAAPGVPAAGGADRFCWSVTAACDDEERRAEFSEDDVDGAWRDLIDAVRDAQSPPGSPTEQ